MADERLKERIDAAHHWLKEARRRYWDQAHEVKNLKRFRHDDGTLEDLDHFHKRRSMEKDRRDHREQVKDHLAKKVRALEHLLKHRREHRASQRDEYKPGSTDIVLFDGVAVVEDAAFWLKRSRGAGWTGVLVSGYRTPEHSEELCYQMCGQPTCPGRCAGRTSNHTKRTYPGPAVDVSNYGQFEAIQYRIGSPYKNDLPLDPVHFSRSGH